MFNFELEPGKQLNKQQKLTKKYKPVISVVMPFWNDKEYIEQAVYCVLNQTFPLFELLIIDDGSTDKESLDKLKQIEKIDSRIKVFHKENGGLASTRDYGAEHASECTEYLFFLDSDDLIEKTYFETAYFALKSNPDASWAYSDCVGFDQDHYTWNRWFDVSTLKSENFLVATAMIKKEVFFEVNGYELREKAVNEDWNFWLKLVTKGYYPVHLSYYAFWYRRKTNGELKKSKENRKRAMEIIESTASTIKQSVQAIQFPRENYNWEGIIENIDDLQFPVRKSDEKAHILMLIPWMIMGGADKFNLDFLKLIDKEKYEVTVISVQPTEYFWRQEFEKFGAEVFDLSTFLDRQYWNLFIDYIIQTRDIDLLFNTNCTFGYVSIPYIKAKHPELPVIDYIHMEEWYNRNGGYSRDSSQVYSLIDKTLFCNQSSEKIMHDYFKVPKEQLGTVYIGVDQDRFDPKKYDKIKLKEKYDVPQDKLIIGFICRIDYQKRPLLLVEIVKKLIQTEKNVLFLIIGDGPLLDKMKSEIKSHQLENYIKFLGKSDCPEEMYAMCDITLNCSIKEGLALTAYESLAMGVPVISSDVGGQKELINDKVGVIVPLLQDENDIYDLKYNEEEVKLYTEAIIKIKNNLVKYQKNARKRVLDGFTIHNMIVHMEEIIDNVVTHPSKRAIQNAKQLTQNMNITKELINYYLLATKEEFSWFCSEYNRKFYGHTELLGYAQRFPKLYKFKMKIDEVARKWKIDKEVILLEKMIFHFCRSIYQVIKCFVLIIKLELNRIRSLFDHRK